MVLLIAFALVAAACSSSDGGDSDTTTTTAAPTDTTTTTAAPADTTTTTEPMLEHPYGGEAVYGDTQEPPTLNSFLPGGDNFIVSIVGQGYAAGVQEISGYTLELIPELVTELPTAANGGVVANDDGTMTVNYTIKDEAVWADGTPITGDDFQFTLDTIMNEDYPIVRTNYEDITATDVGEKTFSFTLSQPTVVFEFMFGEILPKHDIEGTDFVNDYNDTRWVSNGPFSFQEWAKGEYIILERNDNYWKTDEETGQQLPYLDTVQFRFIGETAALINAFKARELDVINPDPNTENIETLQALEPEGAAVEVLNGPVWEHVAFQFADSRFERNENSCNESYDMRLAVAQAIDRTVITDEILAGQVEPLGSYVDAFSPTLSQEQWDQYTFDPAAAAESYAAAVADTGKECATVFTTTSNNDARVTLSELFVDMFAAAGIPYTNDLEDSQLFFGETFDGALWDLGEWAWVGSPGLAGLVSIHDVWDPESPLPDGDNVYSWGVPGSSEEGSEATTRYAAVRDEMNATVDEAVIVPLIEEAEQILADNLVFIPLYARLVTGAVWADEIGNFKMNPTQAGADWNLEYWYRTDS